MEDLICYACDNVATYYYKTRAEFEKKFFFKHTIFIMTCKEHILDDPPGGVMLYERIPFEDYLVYHVMVS